MKYVDIYIVKHLKEPLLGRPAINALDLIATVEAIQSNDARDMEEEIKVTRHKGKKICL